MYDTLSTLLRHMDVAERMYMHDGKPEYSFIPKTNILEGDKEWIITSEIPGVRKEDISISFEDSILKLRAKKELKNSISKDKKNLSEITTGVYERKFKLASDVDSGKIDASYENGVLELVIPKKKEKPKEIEIKIK